MSAVAHVGLAFGVLYVSWDRDMPITQTTVFAVELSPEIIQQPEPLSEPIQEPEPEPEPEPIPEPPEPDPEPEPEPPPPEPEPIPEPEPPAPEPKPVPKPEPPKEEPKPEPPKEKPKPKPDPPKEKPKPKPEPVKEPPPEPPPPTPPSKPQVRMKQALTGPLSAWGRLVQKKVEKSWRLPGGVRIDPKENEAVVSFWVSKSGVVIGTPEIVKHAADPAVGSSAVEAVKSAAPFPPLPDNFEDTEAHVIYTFVPAG